VYGSHASRFVFESALMRRSASALCWVLRERRKGVSTTFEIGSLSAQNPFQLIRLWVGLNLGTGVDM